MYFMLEWGWQAVAPFLPWSWQANKFVPLMVIHVQIVRQDILYKVVCELLYPHVIRVWQ